MNRREHSLAGVLERIERHAPLGSSTAEIDYAAARALQLDLRALRWLLENAPDLLRRTEVRRVLMSLRDGYAGGGNLLRELMDQAIDQLDQSDESPAQTG